MSQIKVDFSEYPVHAYEYVDRIKWRERKHIKREKLAALFEITIGRLVAHETTQRPLPSDLVSRIRGIGMVWI